MTLHVPVLTVSLLGLLLLFTASSLPSVQSQSTTTGIDSSSSSSSSSSSLDAAAEVTPATGSQPPVTISTMTTKIAFGSCHKSHLAASPVTIWETIARTESIIREIEPDADAADDDTASQHDDDEKDNVNTIDQQHPNLRALDAWIWTGDAIYPPHRDPVTHKKTYKEASIEEMKDGLDDMKIHNLTIGYRPFIEGSYKYSSNDISSVSSTTATATAAEGYNIPPPKHIYGVWDDHDFGGNDMGNRMTQQQERKEIFMDFLGYPRSDERSSDSGNGVDEILPTSRPGFYHSFELIHDPPQSVDETTNSGSGGGTIKVIMLDTRSEREDHCIPSVGQSIPLGAVVACLTRWLTSGLLLYKWAGWWGYEGCENNKILGEDQWTWFEHELLSSSTTSDLLVIVSSIQVWSTNPATESWGQFPRQQERLWNLLEKYYGQSNSPSSSSTISTSVHKAPVIFFSGDVHHAEISGQKGWIDVTSSGLTHHCGQHKLYGWTSNAVLERFTKHRYQNNTQNYYIGLNYGVLEVDWERRRYEVQVKNSTGHAVLKVSQSLDDPPPKMPTYRDLPHTWDGHLIPYVQKLMWTCLVVGVMAMVTFVKIL